MVIFWKFRRSVATKSYICNKIVEVMDPLVDIDVRLIFAILNGKVSTAISHKLARDFQKANLELKPEQWNVLQRLTYHDGVSQQELCEVMFKDRPGMVRLVNSMVEAGLVTRTLNRFDRRKNIIRITEKGKRMQEASIRIALQTLRGALRGLSLNDIRTTQAVLMKVFENITESLGTKPPTVSKIAYD